MFNSVRYRQGMTDLNTFNSADESVGDAVTAILCAVAGIFALVVGCIVDARIGVALSWLFVVGGVIVGIGWPAHRPTAAGLVFAGAAPPVAWLLFFWIGFSGSVLFT